MCLMYICTQIITNKNKIMKKFLSKANYQIIAGQLIAVYFLIQLIFRAQ